MRTHFVITLIAVTLTVSSCQKSTTPKNEAIADSAALNVFADQVDTALIEFSTYNFHGNGKPLAHMKQYLIATGTPAGVGPLHAGDTVEVEIEGIGVLANPVVDE